MLLISSSEGMVDGVHTHSLDSRPAMSLCLVFVILVSGLEDRLVRSTSSSDDAEHGSGVTGDGLLGTGRQLELSSVVFFGVGDDDGVGAGSSGEGTSISHVLLDIADDGSFRDGLEGEDVSDGDLGFLAAEHVLAGVETFGGDEVFGSELVSVGVSEDDSGKGGSSSGVVEDLLDYSLDVAFSLEVVKLSELGGGDSTAGVGGENTACSFSLASDDFSHLYIFK